MRGQGRDGHPALPEVPGPRHLASPPRAGSLSPDRAPIREAQSARGTPGRRPDPQELISMSTAIVWAAIVIAAIALIAFALICLGIVRDDRVDGLGLTAGGLGSWLARRVTGLRVEPPPDTGRRNNSEKRTGVSA